MKLIRLLNALQRYYTEQYFFYLNKDFGMKLIIENWLIKYKLHLLVWMLFILYETIVIGLISGEFGDPLTYVAHYIAIVSLFYLHADLSLPWALKNKKSAIWKLPLVLMLEIVGFTLISYSIDKFLIIINVIHRATAFNLSYLYSLKTLYRCIYFLGFATGYYFLVVYMKEKKKTNELEKQRLKDIIYRQKSEQELTKAQNAFLKAQINPHFLFNTLDFVYHNIVSLSPVAADALITLAEMMRYAIDSDKMGDYIYLGDEIDQVENLLYLNQVRKNHELGFVFTYDEKVRQIKLIPLALLTLVENIFKHGNLSQSDHEAVVKIFIEDNIFHIETDNLINNHGSKPSNQTGLSNIRKRLSYAYGPSIEFNYHADDASHFKLSLAIPMECLSLPDGSAAALKDSDRGLLHDYADLN